MAYTDADLVLVRAARVRGVRTVQFADRSVTYSSDAEMRSLEADILRDLSATSVSPTPRSKQSFGVASKGF